MSGDIEPKKVTEYVKVEYWQCNVLGHRHRTKKSAAACMARHKGEAGELKKLTRNISMLKAVRAGHTLSQIALSHYCSDTNVVKAINSSLKKAWRFARDNGGNPYELRSWRHPDLTNPDLQKELDFLNDILLEHEVKLQTLVKG